MKIRIIESSPQPDVRFNGLVVSEDFGLVGFIYSDFPRAKAIARGMVASFNEHPVHLPGCFDGQGRHIEKPGEDCECWCHP